MVNADEIAEMSRSDILARKGSLTKNDLLETVLYLQSKKEILKSAPLDVAKIIERKLDEKLNPLLNKFESLTDAINEIRTMYINLQKKFEKEIKHLQCEMNTLKSETSIFKPQVPEDEIVLKVAEEVRQMEGRRRNLVISGVPMALGNIEERKRSDLDFLHSLHDYLKVERPSVVEDIRRIGRAENQLLKVSYSNAQQRDSILKSARTLRNSIDFKNIYINPDRTPMLQREQRRLRQELKERRDGGEKVVIYRNQIINKDQKENFL